MAEYVFRTNGELVKHLIGTGKVVRRENRLVYNENGFIINENGKTPTEALRIANELAKNVKEKFDFVKISNKDISRWAEDIDKINRLDGYSWHEIAWVVEWVHQHRFWSQQIRSGFKLRKQFEELKVQIQGDKAKQADDEQKKRAKNRVGYIPVPTKNNIPATPEISDEQRLKNLETIRKMREDFIKKKAAKVYTK